MDTQIALAKRDIHKLVTLKLRDTLVGIELDLCIRPSKYLHKRKRRYYSYLNTATKNYVYYDDKYEKLSKQLAKQTTLTELANLTYHS